MLYEIVRFYRTGKKPQVMRRGLSLEEARKHCRDPKTAGKNWFDGFRRQIGAKNFVDVNPPRSGLAHKRPRKR